MILLDTNVLSALSYPTPPPPVVDWLNRTPLDDLWTTSVTLYEVRLGVELLPQGRRRAFIQDTTHSFLALLNGRIAVLDEAAAAHAAVLAARRSSQGTPIDLPDTLIAGIALSKRATLATRNVRHFADLDVQVVDPWATSGCQALRNALRQLLCGSLFNS